MDRVTINTNGQTAAQLLRLALQRHQTGRLAEAEEIYRQILQLEPGHPDALHLSGLLAHQRGQSVVAATLIGKAIEANPLNAIYHSNLGLALKAQGKLDEAIRSYRKALSIKADIAEVHYNLGVASQEQGNLEEAVTSYNRALAIRPDYAEVYCKLGHILQMQGNPDEALASYRQALALKPGHVEVLSNMATAFHRQGKLDEAIACLRGVLEARPGLSEVHNNLGILLSKQGKPEEAVASFHRALSIKPDYAEAQNNLGITHRGQGRLDEAIACFGKALAIRPDYVDAQNNLGKALQMQGKLDEAIASYRRVLLLKPELAETHFVMGNALRDQNKLDEAIKSYRQAIMLNFDYAEAYHNLGTLFKEQGNLEEAVKNLRRALSIRPDFAETHANLGGALRHQGKLAEAMESFLTALKLRPDFAEAYSNLLFLHAYHATLDPEQYLSLARGWETACVPAQDREAASRRTFRNTGLDGRRLRVGYVSGDFRQHAVTYFIEQLFACHDRSRIELFAYSTASVQDAITERIQATVEHWIPVGGISDTDLRDRIEADGIDILIDLSGHTAHSRIGVFARRAAPVQVHYIGFFASTGLNEMDYYIGDEVLTPPETDPHFSEKVWRLPRVSVSYKTTTDVPESDWCPASDGSVWLGSFNDLGKINSQTVNLWVRVLHALPEARLLLKTRNLADAGNRQKFLDVMDSHGISSDRIELQRNTDWADYMAQYNRLDIALDPVSGHGGYTTSCDALWMGVPVIHALGDRATSRMTASMLNAVGRPEWIARTDAEYVDKVVTLARDVEQRKALRPAQRKRMENSPLCDARDLARNLESAYFEMFERWMTERAKLTVPPP
ncbi:MAG: tetratricopeptide repeat protein [Gallionellaceae bacterium]